MRKKQDVIAGMWIKSGMLDFRLICVRLILIFEAQNSNKNSKLK